MAVVAHVGLGGNLGGIEAVSARLRDAAVALDALPGTRLIALSRFHRTPAWGGTAQPDFVNAVAALETTRAPLDVLHDLLAIERAHGRTRADDGSDRWGPRTLDLDLLTWGDAVIDLPGLHVPHPRLHERAFVLVPLAELAPDLGIPGRGRVSTLRAAVAADGIEALP